MAYKYVFLEDAQKDYEASLKWYAERSLLAAENFVKSVDEALASICEYPFMWRNAYKNFHELGLKKYPFAVIYTIEEDKEIVVIHALYHYKRTPKKKYKK